MTSGGIRWPLGAPAGSPTGALILAWRLPALVLDPNMHSTVAARRLLDGMLVLQRD